MESIKHDYLIIGQGIAGTVLAYKLIQKGYSVHVVDDGHLRSSSVVAAGIINPITGRSYVKSWKIDQLLPAARATYESLTQLLGNTYYFDHTVVRVLTTIAEENKWSSRLFEDEYHDYIILNYDKSELLLKYKDIQEIAAIKGGRVALKPLLADFRTWLEARDLLIHESLQYRDLKFENNKVRYGNHTYDKIVFAEGTSSKDNPFFEDLPFQPVKGEVLIVEIDDYKISDIVKHGIFICPIEDNLYWVGSGYDNNYLDEYPTEIGRSKLISQLDSVLKNEYTIKNHIAGVRPSVKGRKPLLGQSKAHSQAYIFGGMGTKGSSLSPFLADHFIDYLEGKSDLDPDIDINRF